MKKLCNPKSKILNKAMAKIPSFEDPNELISVNLEFKNDNIKLMLIPVISAANMVTRVSEGITLPVLYSAWTDNVHGWQRHIHFC